jgi:nucleoside-diphosphate-sugar epimerase
MSLGDFTVRPDDQVLITGAGGFIGSRVVERLLLRGFRNLRCLVRPSSNTDRLKAIVGDGRRSGATIMTGNLLSREDCSAAVQGAAVVFHLAAVRGEKSFPDAFLNTVVTTRNVLDACVAAGCVRRFVTISSFSVYANANTPRRLLDESAAVDARPHLRGDPYCYAKIKQDELVRIYGEQFGIPWVIVRPGVVYGAGNEAIPGRVGVSTFGLFLHLGGSNPIPMTFVDNCADAIVLAGVTPGVDRQVFNVVDDDLPTSRQFLRRYKREVRRFPSIYLPHAVSYMLSMMWEKYSEWSEGQLPPAYNRRQWNAYWKKTRYTNAKLKAALGWMPVVPTDEALHRFFASCRLGRQHA